MAAVAQDFVPPVSQFGFAGRVLASTAAANDVPEDDNKITPIVKRDSPTMSAEQSLLQNAVRILDRIDDTLRSQLQLDKRIVDHQREAFLERARGANDNERPATVRAIEEKAGNGMGGLVATVLRGLGPIIMAALPAAAALAAGKVADEALKKLGINTSGTNADGSDNPWSNPFKAGKYMNEKATEGAKQAYEGAKGFVESVGKRLGFVSKKYESGGRGVGTISTGKGDPGGVSYGEYQLSSRKGTLGRYLRGGGGWAGSAYASQFDGLRAGTAEFNNKWRALAKSDKGFGEEQHKFIAATHYKPALDHAKKLGFDTNDRRIQEMIWSGSVQHGGIKKILTATAKAIDVDSASPEDVVKTFYRVRRDYAVGAMRRDGASQKTIASVVDRYKDEQRQILRVRPEEGKVTPVGNGLQQREVKIQLPRQHPQPPVQRAQPRRSTGIQRTSAAQPVQPVVQQSAPAVKPTPQQRVATATPTPSPGKPGTDISYGMYFNRSSV